MLLDALLSTAGKYSSRLAVADPAAQWDYRHLVLAAATMRDIIAANTKRSNVGLLLPSTGAFAASYFGCLWAGKVPVPLNFLLTARELQAITADAGLDLILSIEPLKEQARASGCNVLYLDQLNLKARAIWRKLRGMPRLPRCADDDVAALLYTSGTAGEPKGVMLTHTNLYADSRACLQHAHIDPERRFIGVLPLFHTFGLMANCVLPLTLGASVYYMPRFQPTQIIKTIARHRIDIMMAVPSMFAALARMKGVSPRDVQSIYLAVSGGEPLPANVFESVRTTLGLTIQEGYGMTETSPVITINMPWKHKPGTVGTAIPGVELRVVDDNDTPLAAGGTGDIQVRGPIVMKGYYNNPELTRQAFSPDGWLRTGDMGHIDAEGFLTISGRKKDIIIISGENVFPGQIERILEMHPAVAQAAVIGQLDSTRGEVPIAYILPHEGAKVTEIELRTFCREYLATYKIPREIHLTTDLPRGPTGKIHKRRLRDMLTRTDMNAASP